MTTKNKSAAPKSAPLAAPSMKEAAALAAVPPVIMEEEAAALAAAALAAAAPAAAVPPSRKEKRDAWRKLQVEARALLAPLLDTAAAHDATGTRKSGEAMIAPEAHALLALAIPAGRAEVRDWSLKGGGTAFQVAGPIAPIEGAATERERALAAAVNTMLAPFAGFRLRVVRYTGKKGVSYSASLALAGK